MYKFKSKKKVKKKEGIRMDENNEIINYIDENIDVKEFKSVETLNVIRKKDIIEYGKFLMDCSKRFFLNI
jgi:hypothetical protein